MENRQEKVVGLLNDLIGAFPETQESVFVSLAKILVKRNNSDEDIEQMVDNTICNVSKTRITVADVLNFSNEKPKQKYIIGA